jgi:hypothetical protein
MSDTCFHKEHMSTPITYEVIIQEQLSEQWAEWFLPLVIRVLPNAGTSLYGSVRDQAELHGILDKVRNLNLTLLSVSCIASPPNSSSSDFKVEDAGDS